MNIRARSLVSIVAFICISPFAALAQNAPAGWSRVTLTGTGLSIESPAAFKLDQDKPDPALRDTTAYVRWSLGYQEIFATVTFEQKSADKKTPRQSADELSALFASMTKPQFSRITDTTFLGRPAALFEEETLDPYAKKMMHRKMVIFGTEGDLTDVNIVYPAGDANAKAIAERMYASVQREGQIAAPVSRMPPTDWRSLQIAGLRYETPNAALDSTCVKGTGGITGYVTIKELCHKWGDTFTISISHQTFNKQSYTPEPRQYAADTVRRSKEDDAESKLNAGHEYTVKPFQIAGVEAAKLEQLLSVGTVGGRTDQVFIRKGNEFWIFTVIYGLRYDFEKAAAERIFGSIGLVSTPTATANVPVDTAARAAAFEAGRALAEKGDHQKAIERLTAAIAIDPKYHYSYTYRAVSRAAVGDGEGAIKDYSAAILFGAPPTEAYYNRGTAYYAQKNYTQAISDLTRSVDSDPQYYRAFFNRGCAYYMVGNLDKAIEDFTSAIKIRPNYGNAFVMRADMLCQKKLVISAIHDEDAAIALGEKLTKRCGRN